MSESDEILALRALAETATEEVYARALPRALSPGRLLTLLDLMKLQEELIEEHGEEITHWDERVEVLQRRVVAAIAECDRRAVRIRELEERGARVRMAKRWWRCSNPDFRDSPLDVLESTAELAAREAVSTWLSEDEDDGPMWSWEDDPPVVDVEVREQDPADPLAWKEERTRWRVTARIQWITEAERLPDPEVARG